MYYTYLLLLLTIKDVYSTNSTVPIDDDRRIGYGRRAELNFSQFLSSHHSRHGRGINGVHSLPLANLWRKVARLGAWGDVGGPHAP